MENPLRVTLPSGGYDVLAPDGDVLDKLASVRHPATASKQSGTASHFHPFLRVGVLLIMNLIFRRHCLRRILRKLQVPASRDGEVLW